MTFTTRGTSALRLDRRWKIAVTALVAAVGLALLTPAGEAQAITLYRDFNYIAPFWNGRVAENLGWNVNQASSVSDGGWWTAYDEAYGGGWEVRKYGSYNDLRSVPKPLPWLSWNDSIDSIYAG